MAQRSVRPTASYVWSLMAFVLAVLILYVGKIVLVPIALAILLTFVLSPVVLAIQQLGVPRIPSVLLTVLLTLTIFGGVGWAVGSQVTKLAKELPQQKTQIERKFNELRGTGHGPFSELLKMLADIVHGKSQQEANQNSENAAQGKPATPPTNRDRGTLSAPQHVILDQPEGPSSIQQLLETANPILEPLAEAGFIFVLVVFMLIRREDMRNRLLGLLGNARLTGTTRVIVDAAGRLSRFLLTQLLINVTVGLLFACGLYALGVGYAFLWGFLLTILRFIPYIGAYIALAFPLLLSFAASPGFAKPIEVLVLFVVLELVTANVVEPLLFGHGTGVSPLALLVAAAFWSWVWGPIGLVLSTPLTVCLVVLGQHVDRLNFLAMLLGDEPALEPHVSYFQRLLARDKTEAAQVVTAYIRTQGEERAYDDVLTPALVLARRERKEGSLTPDEEDFILHSTHEILDAMTPPPVAEATAPDAHPSSLIPQPSIMVVGCPAHHEAEEICLEMLGRLVRPDGFDVHALSTRTLPAEVEETVERENPAVVFIAIVPPGGFVQAAYLCRRLRKRFSNVPIVVGYWGDARHYDRLLVRLRKAGASYVTTSLKQTRSQFQALNQTSARLAPPKVRSPNASETAAHGV